MTRTTRRLMLLAMLVLTAVLLSGCYTEPETIQGIPNAGYNGTVPYPVYGQTDAPTQAPVPTQQGAQIGGLVVFPDIDTPTPNPSQGVVIIGPATTIGLVTNTPEPVATAASVLKEGMSGSEVREMQKKLKALGYLTGAADGDFGPSTKAAVIAFQKAVGLNADGVAGQRTLEKLATSKVTAKPAVTATPKPTATPKVSKNTYLKVGSSGAQVKAMQTRLIELGYLNGTATGKFDNATESGVIAFQKRNTAYADGVAGYETLTALYKSGAKKASSSAGIIGITLKEGATNTAAVKTMQRALKNLGYYTGAIDGSYGGGTLTAVKAFQKANGLTADGVAGGSVFNKLFSDQAKSGSSEAATPKPTATAKVTAPPTYRNVTQPPAGSDYITLRLGDSGELVRDLQSRLKAKGYYSGSVDGKYGVSTMEAVQKFQKAKGLHQDGIAGPATRRTLIEGDFPIGS